MVNREIRQNNVGNLEGPIPYKFTWGLVLLKALPKPSIPVKIDVVCTLMSVGFI